MGESVSRGEKISTYVKKFPKIFPEVFTQMVAVGEQSGKLPRVFLSLAEFFEHEIDDVTKELSTLLEPMLMVSTGVIVGFIALSIISPMYAITQTLHI